MTKYIVKILNYDIGFSKHIAIIAQNEKEMQQQLDIFLAKIDWRHDQIHIIIET